MSAYACEPDRGSEPGVGWNWAQSMAEHANITVVTRANNRSVIEEWEKKREESEDAVNHIHYVYYDLPRIVVWAKKKGILPVQLYYLLWQVGVAIKMRSQLCNFDIVHHVTFNSFISPGFWWSRKTPVLLGPLGGTSCVRNEYRPLYKRKFWKERLRQMLIRNWHFIPWLRISFARARMICCANSETEHYIKMRYPNKTVRSLETGVWQRNVVNELEADENSQNEVVNILWVGTVEPWKALSLALRSFSRAVEKLDQSYKVKLHVVGSGSEVRDALRETEELGLNDRVIFHGRISLGDTHQLMKESDMLLFSSIKDTSGNVVLEAMSMGKPVICLNHQGVGDMTTDETAYRVTPGSINETIEGFASGIVKLVEHSDIRQALGKKGRERIVSQYTWEQKSAWMFRLYKKVLNP